MNKLSLSEFIESARPGNYECIRDPELILNVVEKMWSIPFAEMFHEKWQNMKPSPWEYVYKEFVDIEGLISVERESFQDLPFGEILLILNEEIKWYSRRKEDSQLLDILILFGSLYKYFI